MAEDYITEDLADKRRGAADAQEIQREIIPAWGDRPITKITRDDVIDLIEAIKARGKPRRPGSSSHIKRVFRWACHQKSTRYGPLNSPADIVSPKRVLGERSRGSAPQRRRAPRALARLPARGLPLRRRRPADAAHRRPARGDRGASWRELDPRKMIFTIPPERFKTDAEHLMPLSSAAAKIVLALPRQPIGDLVFSTTKGAKAINGWSNLKAEIDRRMLRTFAPGTGPAWSCRRHLTSSLGCCTTLRRPIRCRMAELRIASDVAEMVIGHGKKGISRVYDQHRYDAEMREACEAWPELLRASSPAPGEGHAAECAPFDCGAANSARPRRSTSAPTRCSSPTAPGPR